MTAIKIVSWNINSVRLRAPNIARFVEENRPDVICLQETKCRNGEFPSKAFEEMGLPHLLVNGQGGGHHGVAIASRLPLEPVGVPDLCREGHARIIGARVAGIELHNIYLPAGGDVPDPNANEKFAHKIDFLAAMRREYANVAKGEGPPRLLLGDLNVAPHENDVWSHRQMLKIVSHTPVETEALEAARNAGGFTDIARHLHGDDQKLYTWWSYRARDWAASNRGRRLDHVWADRQALELADPESYRIHIAYRGGWKPSDHAPVSLMLRSD